MTKAGRKCDGGTGGSCGHDGGGTGKRPGRADRSRPARVNATIVLHVTNYAALSRNVLAEAMVASRESTSVSASAPNGSKAG